MSASDTTGPASVCARPCGETLASVRETPFQGQASITPALDLCACSWHGQVHDSYLERCRLAPAASHERRHLKSSSTSTLHCDRSRGLNVLATGELGDDKVPNCGGSRTPQQVARKQGKQGKSKKCLQPRETSCFSVPYAPSASVCDAWNSFRSTRPSSKRI